MLIYIGTTNTTTGNPRRGWLRTAPTGDILGWIEEGYEGHGAIKWLEEGESIKITVSPSEYKRIKKMGEERLNEIPKRYPPKEEN